VHAKGLAHLAIAPSVPLILVQSTLRVAIYIYIYGGGAYMSTYGQGAGEGAGEGGGAPSDEQAVYASALSLFWGGYLFASLLLYLACDALVVPAPRMRLLLALCLTSLLLLEIAARTGVSHHSPCTRPAGRPAPDPPPSTCAYSGTSPRHSPRPIPRRC
jgi:hypothetical protein